MTALTTSGEDNRPRFRLGSDHVESWFVRANDPRSPRALWLKATVLTTSAGRSLSQAWLSVFDGDRTEAFCLDVPLAEAAFEGGRGGFLSEVGPLRLSLSDGAGFSTGELGSAGGRVSWDLGFERLPGPLGRPMCLLPTRRLVAAPLPRNKLLTPFPAARFTGTLTWNDTTWDLDSWVGMQGHNWGAAHPPEYAWGQCLFIGADGTPQAVVEGASGRIEVGGRLSPLISMLVVRRGEEEYRFDRLVDLWRQRPVLDFPRWTVEMRGPGGKASLEMLGRTEAMVCLAYQNPSRPTSYCLNSKTAAVTLRVTPRSGSAFSLRSSHGAALEFLGPGTVPEVQPVV